MPQFLYGEIAFDLTAYRETDCARFFRNDDRDSIGFFGDANAGSMARPQLC